MSAKLKANIIRSVVPYVGTWIEIGIMLVVNMAILPSFPTWERG